MEKNKVVFLDRDGTINVDYGYVYKTEDLSFIPGALDGLKKLCSAGYKLIIITNQSGIGRKYFSINDYNKFNEFFLNKLFINGIKIASVYYCPHIEEDNCDCRKPKLGLFKKAIREFNVDLDNSIAIGDKERDLCICESTNIKGILIGDNSNKYFSCNNLNDAADYILRGEDR